MPGPNQITPAQLFHLIDTPDCPSLHGKRLAEDIAPAPITLTNSSCPYQFHLFKSIPAGGSYIRQPAPPSK